MCKVIGYDSFSELPGIHLGTSDVLDGEECDANGEEKKKEKSMHSTVSSAARSACSCADLLLRKSASDTGQWTSVAT